VKQWDAHLLTKQHRTSVAREKASLGKAAAKRPAEEGLDGGAKRARLKDEEAEDDGEGDGGGRGGGGRGPSLLPAGFFSAGNRPAEVDEEGDEEDEAGPSTSTVARAPAAKTGDAELDDFFASLTDDTPIIDPIQPAQGAVPAAPRRAVPSRRAEITGVASYEAGPIRNIVEPQKGEDEPEPEPEPEESEAERQERVTREEREEIMGRLEEEERAQWVPLPSSTVFGINVWNSSGRTRIRA